MKQQLDSCDVDFLSPVREQTVRNSQDVRTRQMSASASPCDVAEEKTEPRDARYPEELSSDRIFGSFLDCFLVLVANINNSECSSCQPVITCRCRLQTLLSTNAKQLIIKADLTEPDLNLATNIRASNPLPPKIYYASLSTGSVLSLYHLRGFGQDKCPKRHLAFILLFDRVTLRVSKV